MEAFAAIPASSAPPSQSAWTLSAPKPVAAGPLSASRHSAVSLSAAALACSCAAAAKQVRKKRRALLHAPGRRKTQCQSIVDDAVSVADEATSTVEDALLHAQRLLPSMLMDPEEDKDHRPPGERGGKRRIVILGTGWASHALAKVIDTGNVEVVIVSPRNFFLFTPMLAAASVGTVEYRSILEHIRSANPTVQFCQGSCESIDVEKKSIRVVPKARGMEAVPYNLSYDALVVAIGTKTSSMGVPGVEEHCFFLKQIQDARRIRRRVTECFELADLPGTSEEEKRKLLTFVTVGGGPTGCEFCGELSDFVRNDLQKLHPNLVQYVRIVLVQRGKALLPMFGPDLQEEAYKALTSQGIEVLTGTQVSNVTADSIAVQTKDGTQTVPCGLTMWAAGNGGLDLVDNLRQQLPEQVRLAEEDPRGRGQVFVDEWLRVAGVKDGSIIAMGDCSRIVGENKALPQTAQVAAQQGAFVSRLFNRNYDLTQDGPPKLAEGSSPLELLKARFQVEAPVFKFFDLGKLAYLGSAQAVAQVQLGDVDLSQAAGRAAFLLWRSVYVVKQVSFRNRVLVLFDW
eukprot:CAMPEP_0178419194 /NCGR_PEP_ID=MMETSP0689_2-20121128/25483_1 /TAXON_ID=160604 /ORGANISM="Amphidinium massartii, Strain CS-259" /LENGTH=569 /DNA_ID=CAMNT_0020040621 /DNA_START=77 /DNA_END=1783 /DNA_ORIENTATION=+